MATSVLQGCASGAVLASKEGLSFWSGVDPTSGRVIDAHHPWHGQSLQGRVVMMPTSRGSCTGSGVLLDMALNGTAPAALIFSGAEDILTLGALIADRLFGHAIPVLRLPTQDWAALAAQPDARVTPDAVTSGALTIPLRPLPVADLALTDADRAMRDDPGPVGLAMQVILAMAAIQGARDLVDVTQVHIDGCIYASDANRIFAEKMADMGARVRVPTTMNAISVDRRNWQAHGVPPVFGDPASRLADAYTRMGARPTFTCAPYLLDTAPARDENIAWAESNAVIFANSVIGARTVKHPDFLDLLIAMTGRAPRSGVYLDDNRRPARIIRITPPAGVDDAFWPMLGYLAGQLSPDRIPLIRGVQALPASRDDLKALCGAFGTTSAAPMLHVAGHTPEAELPPLPGADTLQAGPDDLHRIWQELNQGPEHIQLVAFGSPHFSASESRALLAGLAGRQPAPDVHVIVTVGPDVLGELRRDGTIAGLEALGVRVVSDICWCSISEPVFPPETRTLITNSGKYAHYGPGLSGRQVRFGSLSDCINAVHSGHAPKALPRWLA
ncbi:aconitase family protein [Paracoccus sp. DMF-8]|uniref:cis-3-hydroxy-L-proline dehydratase n=1 Tax=Paracoccus sp. DMF-8 TaxID=3019445 RepID=UPI0023E8105A|nr:aconitase family protein [Paracoccus sp. DMF-8]MDF3605078.1 aconitase family protein [Paracoccus sp. DMF-8]